MITLNGFQQFILNHWNDNCIAMNQTPFTGKEGARIMQIRANDVVKGTRYVARFVLLGRTYLLDPSIIVLRWSSALRPAAHDRRSLFTRECPGLPRSLCSLFAACFSPRSSIRSREEEIWLAFSPPSRFIEIWNTFLVMRPDLRIDRLGREDDKTWVRNYSTKKEETTYQYIILRRYSGKIGKNYEN